MIGAIIRFVVSALVLLFVGWITPGVAVHGFWGALFASVVIAGLSWLVQSMLGRNASPSSRGLVGFISAAIVIWLTGAIFPHWITVTWWGAALAAFVIALIDAVVPTTLR